MESRLQEVAGRGCRAAGTLAAAWLSLLVFCAGASAQTAAATTEPRAGDFVLSRGEGIWSEIFAGLNRRDRRYSHVGVVVGEPGGLGVVHAASDDDGSNGTVRLDAWAEYAAAQREFVLLRLADRHAADRAAAAALELGAAAPPFDFDFRLADAAAVYCSELAWLALSTALGRDPIPNKPFIAGRQVVLVENFLLDVPELELIGPASPAKPEETSQ